MSYWEKPGTDVPIPFIRELYKDEPDKIPEAEENFRRYLLLVKQICLRLEREEEEKQKKELGES